MYAISLRWGAMVDAQTGELLFRQDGYRSYDGMKNGAAEFPMVPPQPNGPSRVHL